MDVVQYLREVGERSFWDAWNLVFERSFASSAIGLAIFASSLLVLRWRRKNEEARLRLKEFGQATVITGSAFIFIWSVYFVAVTPARLLIGARRTAPSVTQQGPQPTPFKLDVDVKDAEGRKELERTKAQLSGTQEKLNAANQELEQLRLRLEDRKIEGDNRTKLMGILNDAPKGKVVVRADWTDGEAQQLAREIRRILGETGFTVLDVSPQVLSLNGKGGLYMFVSDVNAPPVHAIGIQQAFKEIGFSMPANTVMPDMQTFASNDHPNHFETDMVIIWISRKP